MDGDRVLVATASRTGSAEAIGEQVARRLRESDLPADAEPADLVRTLAPYRAVILGSETHERHWRHEALAFLHRFRRELAQRDLWLFQLLPADADVHVPSAPLPHRVEDWLDEVRFRGHATFPDRWLGPKHLRGSSHTEAGTEDDADLEHVRAWTAGIAEQLLAASAG